MNAAAIKELYLKAFSDDTVNECDPEDAIELQKLKREAEQKLNTILTKATSDETKNMLRDLVDLHEKQSVLKQVNAFVLGFRKGAQLMNDINR
jgi:hypothetical protein